MFFSRLLYLERNLSWNFDGFATISLFLKHFMVSFVSVSSFLEIESKFFQQAYKVVWSVRLQIFVSFIKRRKSLILILKRNGTSIDHRGISWNIFYSHTPKNELTFTLYNCILEESLGSALNYFHQIRIWLAM